MEKIQKIKRIVKEWLIENRHILDESSINLEILIDTEQCFRIILESADKMGEIIVEDARFAPYRYFKLEIAQIIDDRAQIVNAWYDTENTDDDYYQSALKNGINDLIK